MISLYKRLLHTKVFAKLLFKGNKIVINNSNKIEKINK